MNSPSSLSKRLTAKTQSIALLLFLTGIVSLMPSMAMADLPPCPGTAGQKLARDLRDEAKGRAALEGDAVNQVWASGIEADNRNPVKFVRGDVAKTMCLDKVMLYFDYIRKLLIGIQGLEAAISAFLDEIFNFVCNYAMAQVNNLLNKFCVPLPDLGFSMTLPSPDRKSCDGTPLLSIIPVQQGTPLTLGSELPPDFLSAPMSRWLPPTGASVDFRF